MTQYLIFTSNESQTALDQFNTLNNALNSAFGFPTPDGKTLTWATPIQNPSDSSQVAIPIDDSCLPFLTDAQKNALIALETLTAAGWFPMKN